MTLRKQLFIKDFALLVSITCLVGGCLWGLFSQRAHVDASLREYEGMRRIESTAAGVIAVREGLYQADFDPTSAAVALHSALADLRLYQAMVSQYDNILPPEVKAEQRTLAKVRTTTIIADLKRLIAMVAALPASSTPVQISAVSAQNDTVVRGLTDLLMVCNGFLNQTQRASDRDLHRAIVALSGVAASTVLAAMLASFWQYRLIMVPLLRLRQWCGRTAAGDFSSPYQPSPGREFQELAGDVNKMAAELSAFYRQLEEMVSSKSRELVRSERLASVGYLAAGVAHEINNPLSVISGYAELTLKRLRRLSENAEDSEVMRRLATIRSEAFRCKEITQKLLSLARGGSETREAVSLSGAVVDVAMMVRGLRNFRGKKLTVLLDPAEPFYVDANATEIKQVLLNLIINALEAVAPASGEVRINAREAEGWVELEVVDNGRGMSEETRERVFEPFFTNKRGIGEPGTGLGLSITHAIVADHGGEILARSAGPGLGSRFTVRLPLCTRKATAPTEPRRGEPMEAVP